MGVIQRKIKYKRYLFDVDTNCVLLDISKCLIRKNKFRTFKNKLDVDYVELLNIPLALLVKSIEKNYTILVTDGEKYKQIINKQKDSEIIKVLEFIANNYTKIKNYYGK